MRSLLFLAVGIGLVVSTGCGPTGSTAPVLERSQSTSLASNALPAPSPTGFNPAASGPQPPGWLCKKCHAKSFIYVAAGSEIAIFSGSGADRHTIGAITDHVNGAYGLFVDRKQDLYVANQDGWISAYHSRHLQPWIVYTVPGTPLYVAVDRTGRVYAANRGGTVSEFPAGQTTPDRTLKTPGYEA
ncbi:MAG TPA: hypothetical protein VGK84_02340, partial [Candidatus Tumulicola sp.]